jgi:hypothetical protein
MGAGYGVQAARADGANEPYDAARNVLASPSCPPRARGAPATEAGRATFPRELHANDEARGDGGPALGRDGPRGPARPSAAVPGDPGQGRAGARALRLRPAELPPGGPAQPTVPPVARAHEGRRGVLGGRARGQLALRRLPSRPGQGAGVGTVRRAGHRLRADHRRRRPGPGGPSERRPVPRHVDGGRAGRAPRGGTRPAAGEARGRPARPGRPGRHTGRRGVAARPGAPGDRGAGGPAPPRRAARGPARPTAPGQPSGRRRSDDRDRPLHGPPRHGTHRAWPEADRRERQDHRRRLDHRQLPRGRDGQPARRPGRGIRPHHARLRSPTRQARRPLHDRRCTR